MKFINLTPHDIIVFRDDNNDNDVNDAITFPKSGDVARVESSRIYKKNVNGFSLWEQVFGDVFGLPDPDPDKMFIVSGLVLTALKAAGDERNDVMAPDTSPDSAIRNKAGHIVGVRGFTV